MKKGMIIKIKSQYALVLSNESNVEKIKLKQDMFVGKQIYYFEGDVYKMKQKSVIRVSAMVASLLVIFLIATVLNFGNVANAQPYAAVTIDINPSVELILDEDENVIEVNPLNEDAKTIISDDLLNMNLDEALEWIVDKAEDEGYLVEDGTVLISSVILEITDENDEDEEENEEENSVDEDSNEDDDEDSEDEDSEDETDEVEETIKSFIERKTEQYEFLYAKGTDDGYKASKSQGLSLGKYQMLKFLDDTITQEEIKEMKVTEIAERKQAKEIEKAAKKDKSELTDDGKVVVDDVDNSDDSSNDENNDSNVDSSKGKSEDKNNKNQVNNSGNGQGNVKNNNNSNKVKTGSDDEQEDETSNQTIAPTSSPIDTILPTETPKTKEEKETNKEVNKETNKETNNKTTEEADEETNKEINKETNKEKNKETNNSSNDKSKGKN